MYNLHSSLSFKLTSFTIIRERDGITTLRMLAQANLDDTQILKFGYEQRSPVFVIFHRDKDYGYIIPFS